MHQLKANDLLRNGVKPPRSFALNWHVDRRVCLSRAAVTATRYLNSSQENAHKTVVPCCFDASTPKMPEAPLH
jgi:hypothetical protein